MVYTSKIGDKICEQTRTSSIGLRHICKQLNLPYSTVTSWIYDKDHELSGKYAQAKIQQLHYLMEEILEIADDRTNDYMEVIGANGKKKVIQNKEAIARSRLRINTRIALITKLAPILKARQEETKAKEAGDVKKPEPPEWYVKANQKAVETPKGNATPAVKSTAKKAAEKKPLSSPKNNSKAAPVNTSEVMSEDGRHIYRDGKMLHWP